MTLLRGVPVLSTDKFFFSGRYEALYRAQGAKD